MKEERYNFRSTFKWTESCCMRGEKRSSDCIIGATCFANGREKGKPRNGIRAIMKYVERERERSRTSSLQLSFSLPVIVLHTAAEHSSYWAKEWENHRAVTYSFLCLFFEQVDGVRKNPPERIVNLTRKPSSSSFHHLFTFIHMRHKWWESRESSEKGWREREREEKGDLFLFTYSSDGMMRSFHKDSFFLSSGS